MISGYWFLNVINTDFYSGADVILHVELFQLIHVILRLVTN